MLRYFHTFTVLIVYDYMTKGGMQMDQYPVDDIRGAKFSGSGAICFNCLSMIEHEALTNEDSSSSAEIIRSEDLQGGRKFVFCERCEKPIRAL